MQDKRRVDGLWGHGRWWQGEKPHPPPMISQAPSTHHQVCPSTAIPRTISERVSANRRKGKVYRAYIRTLKGNHIAVLQKRADGGCRSQAIKARTGSSRHGHSMSVVIARAGCNTDCLPSTAPRMLRQRRSNDIKVSPPKFPLTFRLGSSKDVRGDPWSNVDWPIELCKIADRLRTPLLVHRGLARCLASSCSKAKLPTVHGNSSFLLIFLIPRTHLLKHIETS